jgi:ribonuclease BN (tRNA processing enzyme)
LSEDEVKIFFTSPDRTITKGNKTYTREDFLKNDDSYFNLYYTSDGIWDESIFQVLKKGILITECTHYFGTDQELCKRKAHTHFKDILRSHAKNYMKDITIVLVHLGSKIADKIVTEENERLKARNIYFARDMMTIQQDNLQSHVSVRYN